MKAIIYTFSGTGNTMRISKLFAQEFERNGVETLLYNIGKDGEIPNPNDYDYVGFAYPIHAFNAPPNMLRFVRGLPRADELGNARNESECNGNACKESGRQGKEYFILKSSGEPLKLNNISSGKLNKILRRKGYKLRSEYHYAMPYNMIFRHTDDMAAKMWDTAQALAPIEAREILEGKEHKLWKFPFGGAIAFLFRIEHPAMRVNGKMFRVDKDKCLMCGMCEKNCPQKNIHIKDGKFYFGNDCVMCARCSFSCPTDAFNIALLNSWRVNGAYSFKPSGEPQSNKHKRYCAKAYARYFAEAAEKVESDKLNADKPYAENIKSASVNGCNPEDVGRMSNYILEDAAADIADAEDIKAE